MKYSHLPALLLTMIVFTFAACSSDQSDSEGTDSGNNSNAEKNGASSSSKKSTPTDPGTALGNRFLKALQDNDEDAFASCWLSIDDVNKLIENADEGVELPTNEQLEQMESYVKKVEQYVRIVFPLLRKALIDTCGDLNKMSVKKVTPIAIQERDFMDSAASMDVTLATPNGGVVTLNIDDAALGKLRWYFTDKPDTNFNFVASDGTKKSIDLYDLASDEQKEKLDELRMPMGKVRKK